MRDTPPNECRLRETKGCNTLLANYCKLLCISQLIAPVPTHVQDKERSPCNTSYLLTLLKRLVYLVIESAIFLLLRLRRNAEQPVVVDPEAEFSRCLAVELRRAGVLRMDKNSCALQYIKDINVRATSMHMSAAGCAITLSLHIDSCWNLEG